MHLRVTTVIGYRLIGFFLSTSYKYCKYLWNSEPIKKWITKEWHYIYRKYVQIFEFFINLIIFSNLSRSLSNLFKNFMNTKDQILYNILLLLYESYKMIFFVRFKFTYKYILNLIPSLVKRILRAGVSQVATTTFYLSLFGNFLGLLVNKAIWRIIFFFFFKEFTLTKEKFSFFDMRC